MTNFTGHLYPTSLIWKFPGLYKSKVVRVDPPGYSVISDPTLCQYTFPKYNHWMLGWLHHLISIPDDGLTLPRYIHPGYVLISIPDDGFTLPSYIHPGYVLTIPYHIVSQRVVLGKHANFTQLLGFLPMSISFTHSPCCVFQYHLMSEL